jgi:hypothetical protein
MRILNFLQILIYFFVSLEHFKLIPEYNTGEYKAGKDRIIFRIYKFFRSE